VEVEPVSSTEFSKRMDGQPMPSPRPRAVPPAPPPTPRDSGPQPSATPATAAIHKAAADAQAMRGQPAILFTAFEPSGDAHAAPVIAELRKVAPHLRVYAWGGAKMEAAGATILGRTADDGAMGFGALKRAAEVRREIKRIKQWIREYRILAVVVVDSPAANFHVAKAVKRTGARVIHLVAPQLWAWGAGRIRKLRRLTDLVLCLLPFEEQWFNDRDVPARFIGHPTVNRPLDEAELKQHAAGLPSGAPHIAIFPGSRSQEAAANIRLLVNAYTELQSRFSGSSGVICAANANIARIVRRKIKVFSTGLNMVTGQSDAVIWWCDLALTVSGTITLDIARQRKPMVGVYKVGVPTWALSKVILRTPFCLLPNAIAEREIVPEFVPHIGGCMPIVKHAGKYLLDSKNAAIQSEELARVIARFANKNPAEEATKLILKVIKDGTV
jgi:lipid-A-disaccharide synthase